MKKIFVFCFIAAILSSFLVSEEYDIRSLKWGMSFEEVQKAEGLKGEFYKDEEISGTKVEIIFGCDVNGLYSVSYSTPEKFFAGEVSRVLKRKYGEPKSDIDYSYLMKSKDLLKRYPEIVLRIYDKGDFTRLDANPELPMDEKKVIRAGLSRRLVWEYGNTTALLLNTVEGVVLSYWSKPYHNENKKKFADFIVELRKAVTPENIEKKKTEEGEKF